MPNYVISTVYSINSYSHIWSIEPFFTGSHLGFKHNYTKCNLGKSVISAWEGMERGIGKIRYQDGSMLLLVQGVGTQSRQILQSNFYVHVN